MLDAASPCHAVAGGDEDHHLSQVLFQSTASECRQIIESLSLLREYVRTIQDGFVVGRVDSDDLDRLRNISWCLRTACSDNTPQRAIRVQSPVDIETDEMPPLEPHVGSLSWLPGEQMTTDRPIQPPPHVHDPQRIVVKETHHGKTFKKQFVIGRQY